MITSSVLKLRQSATLYAGTVNQLTVPVNTNARKDCRNSTNAGETTHPIHLNFILFIIDVSYPTSSFIRKIQLVSCSYRTLVELLVLVAARVYSGIIRVVN